MKEISFKKYQKAVKIVMAFHQQSEQRIAEFEKKFENSKSPYKNKKDLKVGDFVECIEVHGNSVGNLTKGKKYEVLRTSDERRENYFTIQTDKGQKRDYSCKNTQFKALM